MKLILIFFNLFLALKASAQVYSFSITEENKEFIQSLTPSDDLKKLLLDEISHLNASDRNGLWTITLNQVDSLPNGNLAQIYPRYNPGESLEIVLDITHEGIKNPAVVMEQMIHLDQIFGNESYSPSIKRTFLSPIQWAETVSNAQQGSPTAVKKLTASRLEAYLQMAEVQKDKKFPKFSGVDDAFVTKFIEQQKTEAQRDYDLASKKEKQFLKEAKAKWEKQKERFPSLETQTEKLNDLIAKNDRAGVKKLLEDYLPWPLMEPTEKKAWEEWLLAIEQPNLEKRQVVFRGLDEDSLQMGADKKPYQMSTVLSKNQGNYNRRLRSLTTMRDKFGTNLLDDFMESPIGNMNNNVTVSMMMRNHADNPFGSPFLSASQHDVSIRFGTKKRVALHIDERRILSNIHSTYLSEREVLIPLIIFPDEVIHYEDTTKQGTFINNKKFHDDVEAKLGRTLESFEINSGEISKKEFARSGLTQFYERINNPSQGLNPLCSLDSKTCHCLYDSLNKLIKASPL